MTQLIITVEYLTGTVRKEIPIPYSDAVSTIQLLQCFVGNIECEGGKIISFSWGR